MILICYDGSDDARAAIQRAGTLFPGQRAIALTVWEPFTEVLSRTSYGLAMTAGLVDIAGIDAATRRGAEAQAQDGARLGRAAGLDAEGRTCTQVTSVAEAILDTADELDAEAIIVGSRGLTGLKSLMLGSVSHGLIQHADRAVIVVPSPGVAKARISQAREALSA